MTKQTVTNTQTARYPKGLLFSFGKTGSACKSYYPKFSGWLREKNPYDSEIQDPNVSKGLSLQSILPRVQVTRKILQRLLIQGPGSSEECVPFPIQPPCS